MKKASFLLLFLCIGFGLQAQTVRKGDKIGSIGIGYASMKNHPDTEDEFRPAFSQKVAMEWIVKDGWINNKAALGIGFIVDNAFGGKHDEYMIGLYDYKYTYTTRKYNPGDRHKYTYTTYTKRREGIGSGRAELKRDDLKAIAAATFHFNPVSRLDCYATFGLGVAVGFRSAGEAYNTKGFDSWNEVYGTGSFEIQGSYNDLDHVEWVDGMEKTKVGLAMSLFVGARWWFTKRLAVNAEVGMLGAAFLGEGDYVDRERLIDLGIDRKYLPREVEYGNSNNVLSFGLSYRF